MRSRLDHFLLASLSFTARYIDLVKPLRMLPILCDSSAAQRGGGPEPLQASIQPGPLQALEVIFRHALVVPYSRLELRCTGGNSLALVALLSGHWIGANFRYGYEYF